MVSSCDRSVVFTPLESAIGGVLLGLSATTLVLGYGRVMDFSTILDRATGSIFERASGPNGWDTLLLLGLVGGGALSKHFAHFPAPTIDYPLLSYAAAGFFVGAGTSMCSGCILSHAVCGVGRLSPRSFSLAILFTIVGALTSYFTLHYVEGCTVSPDSSYIVPVAVPAKEDMLPLLGGATAVVVLLVVSLSMAIDWPSPSAQEASGIYTPRRILSWMTHGFVAFSVGVCAGVGFVLAGMLSQEKVRSSLDILGGPWDPSLALAVGVALTLSSVAHRYARLLSEPYLAHTFALPPKSELVGNIQGSHDDLMLLIGSVVFGVGWGVLGISPGASVVGIAAPLLDGAMSGSWPRLPVFVVSSIIGGQTASRFASLVVSTLSDKLRSRWQRLSQELSARLERVRLLFGMSQLQLEADEVVPNAAERSPTVYGSRLQWSTRAPMPTWSQL